MIKKEKRILISLSTLTLQRILKTFAMWLEFLKVLGKVLHKQKEMVQISGFLKTI